MFLFYKGDHPPPSLHTVQRIRIGRPADKQVDGLTRQY